MNRRLHLVRRAAVEARLSLALMAIVALPAVSSAAVPLQIPVQGTLRDNAGVPTSLTVGADNGRVVVQP